VLFWAQLFSYICSSGSYTLNWQSNVKFLNSCCEETFKYHPQGTLVSSSSTEGSLHLMPVFDVAMLIICWIIKGSTGWKLYTHQQFYMNMKHNKICTQNISYCWKCSKTVTVHILTMSHLHLWFTVQMTLDVNLYQTTLLFHPSMLVTNGTDGKV